MAAKQLSYSDDARQSLLAGVSKLARAVCCTLGPRGRNAVIDKGWGSPNVTKDGVTVAEEIELQDPYENMGAQLVKEAASKTSDVAGDGTTTATVLAEAIYREGLKMIAAGHDPMALTRGIQKGVERVVDELLGVCLVGREIDRRAREADRRDVVAGMERVHDVEHGVALLRLRRRPLDRCERRPGAVDPDHDVARGAHRTLLCVRFSTIIRFHRSREQGPLT